MLITNMQIKHVNATITTTTTSITTTTTTYNNINNNNNCYYYHSINWRNKWPLCWCFL